jgi:hypothetical protein
MITLKDPNPGRVQEISANYRSFETIVRDLFAGTKTTLLSWHGPKYLRRCCLLVPAPVYWDWARPEFLDEFMCRAYLDFRHESNGVEALIFNMRTEGKLHSATDHRVLHRACTEFKYKPARFVVTDTPAYTQGVLSIDAGIITGHSYHPLVGQCGVVYTTSNPYFSENRGFYYAGVENDIDAMFYDPSLSCKNR